MSEGAGAAAPAGEVSAGRLLREAREKQGLHIAALAAAIKVSPKKLEMLESDRYDALPDTTFIRALAQTVCRALKTDPAPVMRLLPPPSGHRLETLGEGLNTPFRERPGVLVQQSDWSAVLANPAYGLAALLLLAAAAVLLLPSGFLGTSGGAARPASAAQARVEPGMPPDFVAAAGSGAASGAASAVSTAALSPAAAGSSATAALPASAQPTPADAISAGAAVSPSPAASAGAPDAAASGVLQLRTSAASWVEVTDGRGLLLVSRVLKPGEAVGVDGASPLRVTIGNAAGTRLVFRGQPTDLRAFTRDNVARLELR